METPIQREQNDSSDLWGITAYFNPMHYRHRLCNFRLFRRRLGLPLVAVELGYDGQFDLRPGDADILVHLPGKECDHFLRWAIPFFDAVRGHVSYVPGRIFHLWHGDKNNRGYEIRHQDLVPFQFDPFQDIAQDKHGCWRWNSAKPDLHEYVRGYFATRREDG